LKTFFTLFLGSLFAIAGCKNVKESKSNEAAPPKKTVSISKPVQVTSIHEAALNGKLEQIREILASGINVNTIDTEERTALMYAAYNGHTEILKLLISKGALINTVDLYGRSALMMASSGPFPDVVKLLLDRKADPNIADRKEHFTALMYAASEGQMVIVRLLLEAGADPFMKDVDGDIAATFASNNGHTEIAALLKSYRRKPGNE
jgi:ankyrin repeat protein